jgi:hypothetical protein
MNLLAEWLATGLAAANIIGLAVLGLLLKSYLPSYMKKKGENLATKEDIQVITDLIESTKAIYTEKLEQLRARIATAQYVQSRRDDLLRHKYERIEELVDKIVNVARHDEYMPLIRGLGAPKGLDKWKDYINEMSKRYTEAKDTFDRNAHLFDPDLLPTLKDTINKNPVFYFMPEFEKKIAESRTDSFDVRIAQPFCMITMKNIVSGTNEIRNVFQVQLQRLDSLLMTDKPELAETDDAEQAAALDQMREQ